MPIKNVMANGEIFLLNLNFGSLIAKKISLITDLVILPARKGTNNNNINELQEYWTLVFRESLPKQIHVGITADSFREGFPKYNSILHEVSKK